MALKTSQSAYVARTHKTISGVYGLAFLMFGIFFFVLFLFDAIKDPKALLFLGLLLTLFQIHKTAAYGCNKRAPWARKLSLILGFLMLPAFSIGTIIGAEMLFRSWKPWPILGPFSFPR